MAITILQQPTTPNCSKTNLVYQLSSSNANQPQFQYVMDLYESGSSDRLARIRQFPNPLTQAVFDPSRIFDDNLDYYPVYASASVVINNTDNYKTFTIEFGEEYGTSPSSSVTIYTASAVDNIDVFPCQVDPNNGVGYNFIGGLVESGSAVFLTDRPDGITSYNDIIEYTPVYNGTGTAQDLVITSTFAPVTVTHTVQPGEIFMDANLWGYNAAGSRTWTFGGESRTINYEVFCQNPLYYFYFINRYGVYESFSTEMTLRTNTSISRQRYVQPFVNYGGDPSYNTYANGFQLNRGASQYSSAVTDRHVLSTNWLTQAEALWIRQLLETDNATAYIQADPDITAVGEILTYIPIVVTNTNYIQNTGRTDQKIFAYDIEFEYANQRRGR